MKFLVDETSSESFLDQLDVLGPHLKAGAIAAFTKTGVRVRDLPLR